MEEVKRQILMRLRQEHDAENVKWLSKAYESLCHAELVETEVKVIKSDMPEPKPVEDKWPGDED